MTKFVTLVDYGLGNILSVRRALEASNVKVLITNKSSDILAADYLILPGVGSFADGMLELTRLNLVEPIQKACLSGMPILGICLGMQMLFSESDEHRLTKGIGVINGRVEAIPNYKDTNRKRKVPHIGWGELSQPSDNPAWAKESIMTGMMDGISCYFVHSYVCVPVNKDCVLAECTYDDLRFCAAVKQDNVYGCQFHPEKSGPVGLKIIKNFISL